MSNAPANQTPDHNRHWQRERRQCSALSAHWNTNYKSSFIQPENAPSSPAESNDDRTVVPRMTQASAVAGSTQHPRIRVNPLTSFTGYHNGIYVYLYDDKCRMISIGIYSQRKAQARDKSILESQLGTMSQWCCWCSTRSDDKKSLFLHGETGKRSGGHANAVEAKMRRNITISDL